MQKGLIVHVLISNKKGEILILERSKKDDVLPGYWDIPGGTLEDGEDPALGAIREVKEETGLTLSSVKLFFHTSNVDVKKNKQFVRLIFHAQSHNAHVTVNPEEHDSFQWIKPSTVSNNKLVDYLPNCLHAYNELNTKPIN